MRNVVAAISVGMFAFSVSLLGHDWPLKPFDGQHQINSTLGEYRSGHFHKGVDIKPFGSTPTDTFWLAYSILSDTVYWTNGTNPGARVGKYWYIHLTNRVRDTTYVTAFQDTIGRVQSSEAHLHFHWTSKYPPVVDTVFNPLWVGALSPYVDSTEPHVDSILFYRQATDTLLADTLDRRVDILCVAGDSRTDSIGQVPSDPGNVSVYRIGYQVRNTSGNVLRSWERIKFDTIPAPSNDTLLSLTYASGSSESHFRYWITNDPFNADSSGRNWYWNTKQKAGFPDSVDAESTEVCSFPRGDYLVKVLAYDIRNNETSDSVEVYIDNFPPRIDSVSPPDSAADVPCDAAVSIRFDEPIDTTVNMKKAVTFSPGVSGSWVWQEDSRAVFSVDPAFERNTKYTVTAKADSIRDLVGRTLDGDRDGTSEGSTTDDYTWSFTTGDEDGGYSGPNPVPFQWEGARGDEYVNFFNTPVLFNVFSFLFYGNSYDWLYATKTGSIWFDTPDYTHLFDLPSANGHLDGVIAPYNDQIYVGFPYPKGEGWGAIKSGPSRKVVEWQYINPDPPLDTTSFEAVIFQDGQIRFDYRRCDIDPFFSDGGSGISSGDSVRYISLTDEVGPVWTLAPGSYQFTTSPPPGSPENLALQYPTAKVPSSQVSLTWDPNPESDLAGYNVYRLDPDTAHFRRLNDTIVTTTQYTDAGADSGAVYTYAATAEDTFSVGTFHNESWFSNYVTCQVAPFSSDCSTATAFNNGRKLVFGTDSTAHLVFEGYGIIWYGYSLDFGESWCPAIPLTVNGTWPAIALDSQDRPHVVWVDKGLPSNLHYAQGGTGRWDSTSLCAVEDSVFAPSFAIGDDDSGRLAFTHQKAVSNQLTYACFYTQTLPESLLDKTVLDTFDGFGQASIGVMDYDKTLHIVYERADTTDHIWRDTTGSWAHGFPPSLGHFPSGTVLGEQFVMTREHWHPTSTSIVVNSWHRKGLGWMPPIDGIEGEGCFPVFEGPWIVCWAGIGGGNWEIWRTLWQDNHWADWQNISQTPSMSKHPHFACYQLPDTNRIVTAWTEGDSAPFWIRLKSEKIAPTGLYVLNLGQEDPSPFTVQREGYISHGAGAQIHETVDYHPSQLSYRLGGLNPKRFYKLALLYYHEDSATIWQEQVAVDGRSMARTKVQSHKPGNATLWLPEEVYRDGEVVVAIKRVGQGKAVLGALTLYESMGPGGTIRVTDDHRLPPAKAGKFSLRQLPNPARHGTRIDYELPAKEFVSLRIYDIAGRLVRLLDEGRKLPGRYSVYWDGTDGLGAAVSSGIYFVSMRAGAFKATKKAVFLK